MGCKLLGMGFLKSIDSFIVGLELFYLVLKFLHAAVEATFELLNLAFEVSYLGLMILIKLLLFSKQALFVLLELLEALFLFFDMLRL